MPDGVSAKAAARGLLAVEGGVSLESLAPPLREAVRGLLPLVRRSDGPGSAYARVAEVLGEAGVRAALEGLATALRDLGLAADSALVGELLDDGRPRKDLSRDAYDAHREWGLSLLTHGHRAFSEGRFLLEQLAVSGPAARQVDVGEAPDATRARFEAALARFAPSLRVLTYTGSGSDAVNAVYEIARRCGEKRLQPHARGTGEAPSPGVAFFTRSYGGGRGPSREMNFMGWPDLRKVGPSPYRMTSPALDGSEPTEARLREVQALEEQALERIRELASDARTPLGAILIEVTQGPGGVLTFRADFLRRLRTLADALAVPIIADEVLTCGGRTGRFFAYEHFDFVPDFVTFAKGLQVNGIAAVERPGQQEAQRIDSLGDDVGVAHPVDFLKAARVLRVLEEERLVERATVVGRRVSQLLGTIQQWHGHPREVGVAGAMLNWRRPPEVTYLIIKNPDAPIPFGEREPLVRERMHFALDITADALARMFWVASRWQEVGGGVPPVELLANVLGEPFDLSEEQPHLEPGPVDFDARQVALATLMVRGGLSAGDLDPRLRPWVEQLRQTGANLPFTREAEVLAYRLVRALGRQAVAGALESLAAVVAKGVVRPAPPRSHVPVLHAEHPAFRRGAFTLQALLDAGQNRSLALGEDSPSRARTRFEKALRDAVPGLHPVEPANDAAEALRCMFEIARELGLRRMGAGAAGEPRPAFFLGSRGAGRGPGAALRSEAHALRAGAASLAAYALPDVTLRPADLHDERASSRVEADEHAALARIRHLASHPEHPLGAVYLESLRTGRELRVYRPEFLRRLRALADELRLPLIADELDTAGGRAGTFFAFQRTALEPDYVVYGGLPQHGIAFLPRDGNDFLRIPNLGLTTAGGTAADYHASAEVLAVLQEEHLMERALQAEQRALREGRAAFGAWMEHCGEVVTQPLDLLPPSA
ncbi:aminotransferase class III-fold pyridoxal phosphate-dependent enzyme [Corallococcus sp. ZKHCc1 1396]|uniref:Aminotransferase class III-fold pyridoxal phosphate-dependent enzyme n=1 Tax=Corallococcus soli TaxID=2710757 RepID=A0ABR9PVG6_9BACT|nr:aminotransferase class III-fold pyridoxal phosphate-dependent enzyme [Corallococcus soli]MBE4751762.1 aminotransferase class III-fold pyridoxal phosphate-dependent enzyme [Corallococcus soli]